MKTLLISILTLVLISCSSGFKDQEKEKIRLYLKEVDCGSATIDWFFYSEISFTSSDYLLISDGQESDTICLADNISDVYCMDDTIRIEFFGTPMRSFEKIEIPSNVLGHEITVDSTIISDGPQHRKWYKKE